VNLSRVGYTLYSPVEFFRACIQPVQVS
jgi:hypothetical protein